MARASRFALLLAACVAPPVGELLADGALVDEGLVPVGTGLESIVGAIGVQP